MTPVEDDARIKRAHFNFVPVARIEAVEAGTVVDVCGIAVSVGTVAQLMSKSTGKELMKRDVTLGDMSGASITLTLWGEKTALEISPGNVVCAKMVKVGDFGGRSLSTLASSIVLINPEGVPQAETLLGWCVVRLPARCVRSRAQSRAHPVAGTPPARRAPSAR